MAISVIRRAAPPGAHEAAPENGSKTDLIEDLYVRYRLDLIHYVRSLSGQGPPEPEDVAQRAFAKVYEVEDLSAISNLPGFLWRTARNILISEKRHLSVRAHNADDIAEAFFPSGGDVLTPERVLLAKDQMGLVTAALSNMPKKRRRILIMNRIEKLSYTEIGRRLGIGRTAVTKHVAKAMADIDAALAENEDR